MRNTNYEEQDPYYKMVKNLWDDMQNHCDEDPMRNSQYIHMNNIYKTTESSLLIS